MQALTQVTFLYSQSSRTQSRLNTFCARPRARSEAMGPVVADVRKYIRGANASMCWIYWSQLWLVFFVLLCHLQDIHNSGTSQSEQSSTLDAEPSSSAGALGKSNTGGRSYST